MEKYKSKKLLNDNQKALILRWWGAGAVYFMIGMGMPSIGYTSLIDIILALGLGLTILNLLVIEPVIHSMFKIEKHEYYLDTTVSTKIKRRLSVIFSNFLIVYLIMYTYEFINVSIIFIFGLQKGESVPLPAEPILFGVFYVIYYTIFKHITNKIKRIKK